tara:strand:- start:967 stop:2421 length:1455 start_codon:yes stop_codon:yes gene_type:complete
MRGFNPITDLRPPDPFNEPAGESTESIEGIRIRLVSTRNKTAELVQVIKTKNISFKKDIDKIQELNRRLRKTIPRIPIMRGDAAVTTGVTVEEQFRKSFGLRGGFARFGQKAPVKPGFPLLDVIIAAILAKAGIKKKVKIGGSNNIRNFIRKNNKPIKIPEIYTGATKGRRTINITDFVEDLTQKPKGLPQVGEKVIPFKKKPNFFPQKTARRGTAFEGDASQRTVDVTAEVVSEQNIISRLTKIFDARKLKKFSKEKGFLNFSKKADKIKASSNVPFEMRPYDTGLEVNRYVTQAQRAFTGKSSVKFPNSLSIKTLFNQNKADLQVMLKDRESKLKNLTPGTEEYRNMKRSIQLVNNGIRRINNSYKTYLNSSKRRLKKNVQVMKESGLNYTDPMIENLERDMKFRKKFNKDVELFEKNPEEYYKKLKRENYLDKIESETFRYNKNKSRVNAKPMSNDIAMLNTDTGITNTTIIITDPNNFLT